MQKSHRIFLNVVLNKTIGSFTNFQKQLNSTVKFLGSLNCQTFSSENKRLIFNYEEKTMIQFILAALFFIILHIGVSGTSVRDRVIEKLGENVYHTAFSLLSLLGIVWLAHAYRVAGYLETWGQLVWFKPIAVLLMLVAFLLAVLGMTTPNPMAVGGEKLLMADAHARGIQRVTRHPFLWGVALWAVVHLIANGDVASLVLFGSLLVVVLVGMASIDAKRKKACGRHWDNYAAATSIIPFQAIKEGRNTLEIAEFKVWQLVAALVFYLAVMHFHQAWFGVSPLF
jgi:uncharacterized membrane protein